MDMQTVCQYIGRFYIESNFEIDKLRKELADAHTLIAQLRNQLINAQRGRENS